MTRLVLFACVCIALNGPARLVLAADFGQGETSLSLDAQLQELVSANLGSARATGFSVGFRVKPAARSTYFGASMGYLTDGVRGFGLLRFGSVTTHSWRGFGTFGYSAGVQVLDRFEQTYLVLGPSGTNPIPINAEGAAAYVGLQTGVYLYRGSTQAIQLRLGVTQSVGGDSGLTFVSVGIAAVSFGE